MDPQKPCARNDGKEGAQGKLLLCRSHIEVASGTDDGETNFKNR